MINQAENYCQDSSRSVIPKIQTKRLDGLFVSNDCEVI